MTTVPHSDGLAALLLSSTIALSQGEPATFKPLSLPQWRSLIEKLERSPWHGPGDLLGQTAASIEQTLGVKPESAERIVRLLDRSGQVAVEVERLAGSGIWVLTECDEAYPNKLGQRLGKLAPPVLFGAGPASLLSRDAIALVGSRDLDPAGEAVARELSARCATEGITVVTGGTRGTDRVSMITSLEADGNAVGVLADSLQQTLPDGDAARFIREDHLTLITPFDPATEFTASNAMARNKVIYGLAHLAVVVASAAETGDTWAGATENLTNGWVPLFVKTGGDAPDAHRRLIEAGGHPFSPDDLPGKGRLLAGLMERSKPASANDETLTQPPPPAEQTTVSPDTPAQPRDVFEVIWPVLASFLLELRTEQDVAEAFVLEKAQARTWLRRAVDEGRAQALTGRTRRYRIAPKRLL